MLGVWFDCSLWELIQSCELLTTSHKVLLVDDVGIESWIIFVHVLVYELRIFGVQAFGIIHQFSRLLTFLVKDLLDDCIYIQGLLSLFAWWLSNFFICQTLVQVEVINVLLTLLCIVIFLHGRCNIGERIIVTHHARLLVIFLRFHRQLANQLVDLIVLVLIWILESCVVFRSCAEARQDLLLNFCWRIWSPDRHLILNGLLDELALIDELLRILKIGQQGV